MKDGRDIREYQDESGNNWLMYSNGRPVTDSNGNRIPGRAQVLGVTSGWKDYDTSQGHCGLCGSLTCNGRCCK